MLEQFYPGRVFARLPGSEQDFWENKGLNPRDWVGLAGLVYADVFSLGFLQPLEDTDTQFRLEPQPGVDLSRYTDMARNVELKVINGPDLFGAVYAPRGNIQIHSPYLEVSSFNPRGKQTSNIKKPEKRCDSRTTLTTTKLRKRQTIVEEKWQPWKRQSKPYNADKLVIPLPIPHPVHIAVTIYNRDSEDPIPLDLELCQSILRAVEESPGDIATECVSRYRGGGGDSSFDSVASRSSVSVDTGLDKENNDPGYDTNARDTANDKNNSSETYHWTLSNWSGDITRRRNNSGSVKVDLASPEDVTLDTDTTRVMFSTYGTTV